MNDLQTLIDRILELRNTAAVQRLCLDCWAFGQRDGELAGILHARNLLAGVRRFVAYEARIRGLRA